MPRQRAYDDGRRQNFEAELKMDLDAYLARIGYAGPRTPSLETLQAIHRAHAQSIPFENLNPLMHRSVALDIPALEAKLVHGNRGGYCFEQNGLLLTALRELGFDATGLAARVIWNTPEEVVRPRTHMLLRIRIGGDEHIADVGFGGQTLTGPLRLMTDVEQSTPHEPFRLIRMDSSGDLKLQSWVGQDWKTLYRFDLQPQTPSDYEMANYYVSTNPASHFRSTVIAALPFPGGRHALANNQLTTHKLGAPSEHRTLTSVGEVREVLETVFGLTLPEAAELDPAIARACGFSG